MLIMACCVLISSMCKLVSNYCRLLMYTMVIIIYHTLQWISTSMHAQQLPPWPYMHAECTCYQYYSKLKLQLRQDSLHLTLYICAKQAGILGLYMFHLDFCKRQVAARNYHDIIASMHTHGIYHACHIKIAVHVLL